MQSDTSDCIREPIDSWQGEAAEESMVNKDIHIINRRPNIAKYLGGLGNGARCGALCGARRGARWIIHCCRGFRDCSRSCFEHEKTVDEWCFIYED